MEDRYLFKAKRLDDGEWVQGYIVKYGATGQKKWYIVSDYASDLYSFLIDKNTICQCTGLKDKNGKLIWENDVVAYWDTYSTESGLAEVDCVGQIVWSDKTMSFQVTNRLSAESYEVLDECSVIGNIVDDKELLEGVE